MSGDSSVPPRPPKIDTSVPHAARIWNYWLGGKDNYEIDREVGDKVAKFYPDIVTQARLSRYFLARVIHYLVSEAGIRQFLDIGAGLPTVDNTHDIAQRIAPDCRIVYVDNDPLVLAHARALLTSGPDGACDYIDADLRDCAPILEQAARTLDFAKPLAIVLNGVMGLVADDGEARAIVRRLVDGLPRGSYLVLSDGSNTSEAGVESMEFYASSGAIPYRLRSPEQISRFFDGLELVEPGIVALHEWRPEAPSAGALVRSDGYGGVGRKP